MIPRRQQPPVVRLRLIAIFQPAEAVFHCRPHVRGWFRKRMDLGAGRSRERREFRNVRADDDQYVPDSATAKGGDDVLQDRPIAKAQRQLRPAHARALSGGGDDCEGHPLLVVKFVYRLDKLFMTAPYEASTRRLCGTKRVSPAAPMISSSAPGRSGVALRSAKLPRRG